MATATRQATTTMIEMASSVVMRTASRSVPPYTIRCPPCPRASPETIDEGKSLAALASEGGVPQAPHRGPPVEHRSLPALLAYEDHVPRRSLHPPTPSSVLAAAADCLRPRSPPGRTSFALPLSIAWLRAYTSSASADKIYLPLPARHLELVVEPKFAYISTLTAPCAMPRLRRIGLVTGSTQAGTQPSIEG